MAMLCGFLYVFILLCSGRFAKHSTVSIASRCSREGRGSKPGGGGIGRGPSLFSPHKFETGICHNGGIIFPKLRTEGRPDRRKPTVARTSLIFPGQDKFRPLAGILALTRHLALALYRLRKRSTEGKRTVKVNPVITRLFSIQKACASIPTVDNWLPFFSCKTVLLYVTCLSLEVGDQGPSVADCKQLYPIYFENYCARTKPNLFYCYVHYSSPSCMRLNM